MPSKPAGNSNQTTTQNTSGTQTVTLPDWVNNAAQGIYGQAQNVASNLQPAVAPITGQANAIVGQQAAQIGAGQSGYQSAINSAQGLTNFQPGQVNAGFLSGTNLQPYMNPYTQDVINSSLPLIDQSLAQQQNQTADAAVKTGAFAGSRQGVQEGVNDAQTNLLKGQLASQLNAQNFSQAQGAATNDLNRSLTAQQSNQQAGIQGANLNLNAANSAGNLISNQQSLYNQQLMAALGGQQYLQQGQQAQLTGQQQNPLNQLQVLLSAIGGVPYGQTNTTNSSSVGTGLGPVSNPALQGIGALGSLASTAGTIAGLFA